MTALRRSTRLTSKGGSSGIDHDHLESDVDEDEQETYRPRKRQSTRATHPAGNRRDVSASQLVKGKRGKLARLVDMPLDVLFDIFGHLRPLDLLHLAWSTKSLRDILMRRRATSIWKQARQDVEGLPDCPRDLTEPQYARLAFDAHCHFCFAPSVTTVMWACRVRCCSKCIATEFTDAYHFQIEALTNYTHTWTQSTNLTTTLIQAMPHHDHRRGRWHHQRLFLKSDVNFITKFLLDTMGDPEKFDNLLSERKEMMRDRNAHAVACVDWYRNVATNRSIELHGIRMRRKHAIAKKLRGLGWGDELGMLEQHSPYILDQNPLVRQPKDLTERIWNNIKAPIIEIMEKAKADRLERERNQRRMDRQRIVIALLKEYTLTRPPNEIIPGSGDVCDMEEFRNLILAPAGSEITEASFAAPMARLPELSEAWRLTNSNCLLSLLPSSSSASDVGLARLELATSLFRCNVGCRYDVISYPRILGHRCMTASRGPYGNWDESEQLDELSCGPWNFDGKLVSYNEQASRHVRALVESCGLDPDIATSRDMNDIDARFVCGACTNGDEAVAWSWTRAIKHILVAHSGDFNAKWIRLTPEQRLRVKARETIELSWSADWCCTRCRMRTSLGDLKNHIRAKHDVQVVNQDDYYMHFDPSGEPWMPPITVDISS